MKRKMEKKNEVDQNTCKAKWHSALRKQTNKKNALSISVIKRWIRATKNYIENRQCVKKGKM